MNKIFVIGSINRDLVLGVDQLPQPKETIFGNDYQEFPGGKGANQAVAVHRLGGDVSLVGNIGTDSFGRAMLRFFEKERLDISGIQIMADADTGKALIIVDRKAENSIIVLSGANMQWQGRDVSKLGIAAGDIVVCQFEIPHDVIARSFALAKARGATTILNPAPIQSLAPEILANTDYIILNEVELEKATGMPVKLDDIATIRNAAQDLRTKGVATVIATLGAQGVLLIDAEGDALIPGRRVQAVDTTGAGDCFIGAFAAGLSRGLAVRQALLFANHAAAISVTRDGASSSMPNYHEVIATMPGEDAARLSALSPYP